MAIQPVNLPTAAGIDYGRGDVRHFSPGDAMDVPSVQNPTRHLAERDNMLAEKVNEVITTVNNQEQFVPVPVVRTLLTPNEEVTVYNYRIPSGFECRVMNAAVSATPVSQDIELKVYYAQGFGGVTGSEVVVTASEFTGGIQFYNNGEFIVALKNKSAVSLELSASLLLSLRVLGAEGSLLVASVVQGERGTPGPTGPPGPQGIPGSGGEGSPGMVWKGPYSALTTYVDKEVVSYPLYGSLVSSFIARTTVPAATITPEDSYLSGDGVWEVVAIGAAGPQGDQGDPGTSGGMPVYYNATTTGTLTTGEDWLAGTAAYASYYSTGILQASRKYSITFQQPAMLNTPTSGLSFLMASHRFCATGHGTIYLPQKAFDLALCNYTTSNTHISFVSHGTIPVYLSANMADINHAGTLFDSYGTAPTVIVNDISQGTGWAFQILNPTPVCVSYTIFGAQQVVP